LLCLAVGIRYAITTGGNKIFIFALLSLISFLFAWLRHRERKKG
jgi:hypothetical protein